MKTCTPIFTPDQTIYSLIFEPSIIEGSHNNLLGYLKRKINSNHKLSLAIRESSLLDMVHDVMTNHHKHPDPIKSYDNAINIASIKDFSVMSIYEKTQHFLVMSACYRVFQILSISLQHKVALSRLNKPAKFMLTGVISVIPIFATSFLGFSSIELGMMSLLVGISPYVLNNKWSNRIKEIDLISTTRGFVFKSSLLNCCLSSIRNLSSTLLAELGSGLILASYYFFSNNEVISDFLGDAFTTHSNIEICRYTYSLAPSYGQSVFTPSHFFAKLLLLEVGWCLGRLAIDVGLGLMQKAAIISDSRDPFYNHIFKARISKPIVITNSLKSANDRSKTRVQQQAQELTDDSQYDRYAAAQIKRRNVKVKKPTSRVLRSYNESLSYSKATTSDELEVIQVPDYPSQPLVPFYPFSQSSQTYGVVASLKVRHFNEYAETLNKAHNRVAASKGFIECVSPQAQVYTIRPNLDARLVGQKVTGQSEVIKALKIVYGYERAWLVTERIQSRIGVPTTVAFTKETNHAQLNKVIARFK